MQLSTQALHRTARCSEPGNALGIVSLACCAGGRCWARCGLSDQCLPDAGNEVRVAVLGLPRQQDARGPVLQILHNPASVVGSQGLLRKAYNSVTTASWPLAERGSLQSPIVLKQTAEDVN
jgi:hypothetical protein